MTQPIEDRLHDLASSVPVPPCDAAGLWREARQRAVRRRAAAVAATAAVAVLLASGTWLVSGVADRRDGGDRLVQVVPASAPRPSLNEPVSGQQLAGVQPQPDGPAVIVAEATGTTGRHRVAAFRRGGKTCLAPVKPAPGLVVCDSGYAGTELVVTGTAGAVEGGTGSKSLFFGYVPQGTTRLTVETGGRTITVDVYEPPAGYEPRLYFVTDVAVAADHRLMFRGFDAEGRSTGTKTLGG